MSYDFKYVPTSGSLSGESFISQTEIAFNELGHSVEEVVQNSEEANILAESANLTATEALTTANDAFTTAQSADIKADTAIKKAEGAETSAGSASSRADEAYDLAATAKSESGSASGSSAEAEALAKEAKEISLSAKDLANAALGSATVAVDGSEQALKKADEALELAEAHQLFFKNNPDAADADTLIGELEKSYYTGDEPLINFPLEAPLWFEVRATNEFGKITQDCWNGSKAMRRTLDSIPTPLAGDNLINLIAGLGESGDSGALDAEFLISSLNGKPLSVGLMGAGSFDLKEVSPSAFSGDFALDGFLEGQNDTLRFTSSVLSPVPAPPQNPVPDNLLIRVTDGELSIVQKTVNTGLGNLTINSAVLEGGRLILEISFAWTYNGTPIIDPGEWYGLGGGDEWNAYVPLSGGTASSNYESSLLTEDTRIHITADSPNVFNIYARAAVNVTGFPLNPKFSKMVTLNFNKDSTREAITWPPEVIWANGAAPLFADPSLVVVLLYTNGLILGSILHAGG